MNLFKKTQLLFDNFDNTVRQYLSKTFNNLGMQYTHSQIFGVIFDGIKGVLQNAMFYIEDALSEQNIYTAIRKKSVYSLAKISGYEPYYGSAAVGTLIGRMQVSNELNSKSTKIYIPNHMPVFNRTTQISYIIQLPTEYYVFDISKPLVNHEFKIIQGYFYVASYTGNGTALQSININSSELFDKQYIRVLVNGKEWQQVSNFYDMTENGEEYVYNVGFDNAFSIVFGNGIHGRRPNDGDKIDVEYLKHTGVVGNILPSERSDFIFSAYGYDLFGNSVDLNNYIKLEVATCVSGGTNDDSIEFIKTMIGKNSRSLVLASEDNFNLFFKRFSFIGYVNCWTEANSMYIMASCTKDISAYTYTPENYYDLTDDNYLLSLEQKQMIITTLENSKKTFAGVTLKFQDPVIRKFALICYVKINNIYDRDLVKTNINKYVAQYFISKIANTQFIAKSDIVKYLLDCIPEITSLEITILSQMAEEAFKNSYYIDYDFVEANGNYTYIKKNVMYEENKNPGLDDFGNIELHSKLEIPVLTNNFKYYPNKKENINKYNMITLDAVSVYFI